MVSPDALRALKSPHEQHQAFTDQLTEQAAPAALSLYGSVHPRQVVRQDHSTPRNAGSRHSSFGTLLLSRGGPPCGCLPHGLRHPGVRWPAFSQPSLRILYCSWLT
jgi:hypothetical protein